MKKEIVKKISLIVLLIMLSVVLSTNVYASDYLFDLTSNTAGKTNTVGQSGTQNQNEPQDITNVQQLTFSTVDETVYATANVNIRSSYSNTSNTIGSLTKNQSIKRTGISSDGTWSKVTTTSGQTGYIESTYLTKTAPQITTVANNVNSNTSVYNNVTNTLPKTGVESNTSAIVIMVICVAAAIYAYKKIRDYNI